MRLRSLRVFVSFALGMLTATTAATAQQSPSLRVPANARRARQPRVSGNRAVVDCATHGVWSPPPGWNAFDLGHSMTLAMSPTSGAALVRASLRSHVQRAAVGSTVDALVGSHVALPAPAGGRVDTRVSASVGTEPVEIHWLQRGDELWLSIVTSHEASSNAAIDTARASYLRLVSHACECNYDCEFRPR